MPKKKPKGGVKTKKTLSITGKKGAKKKENKKKNKKTWRRRAVLIPAGALVLLAALSALIAGRIWIEKQRTPAKPGSAFHMVKPPFHMIEKDGPGKPLFEEPGPDPGPSPDRGPIQTQRTAADFPRAAIIIDDLGCDAGVARKILELDPSLTLSALPHCPFSVKIIQMAQEKGFETMLHLPMEPDKYPHIDPGPGSLLTSMDPEDLIKKLVSNLDAMPGIKGVNNHMGSKMTARESDMALIFSTLEKRGLFFIDSRTSAHTQCRKAAEVSGVKFAERDVFIDHIQSAYFIQKQLKRFTDLAVRRGKAIGIAHPHALTIDILRRELPAIKKKIKLVSASELTHYVR
ncbi:conserved hypothetical protein [Candidatus Desulfarcum epimagneticum]|uniref:Divergent polysaccharide deacetylase family protein n=1 Tax=uncultured Desulfobacteraceae bacterium TaxID=218296 RepID=A0A484HFS3_9BACT|nr:conserved hypothetical protein [uncultured Desulfobacteraceae bacterium]